MTNFLNILAVVVAVLVFSVASFGDVVLSTEALSGGTSGGGGSVAQEPNYPESIHQSFEIMGIAVDSHAYNSEDENGCYASAYTQATIKQGVSGRYYVLNDCNTSFYTPDYDPGTWRFSGHASFIILDKLPETDGPDLNSNQGFRCFDIQVNTHSNIMNSGEWFKDGLGDYFYVENDDIVALFGVSLESESAVVYSMNTYIDTWHDSWSGNDYLQINTNAYGHLPEPATALMLIFGGIGMLIRRRRK